MNLFIFSVCFLYLSLTDALSRLAPAPSIPYPPRCPKVACDVFCPHGHQPDVRGCPTCKCTALPSIKPSTPYPPRCPKVACDVFCPHGHQPDVRGCPTCKCMENSTSISNTANSTSINNTAKKVNTANSTSIINTQKCTVDGVTYLDGERYKVDCNTCTCTNGTSACTEKFCLPCFYEDEEYESGEYYYDAGECNVCYCTDEGWECTEDECRDEGPVCAYKHVEYYIGETFSKDKCNTCTCTLRGIVCTDQACDGSCAVDGVTYLDGERYKVDCNTCTCTNGTSSCTEIACATSCSFNGVNYNVGQTYKVECNTCNCTSNGPVCTEKLCPPSDTNNVAPNIIPVAPPGPIIKPLAPKCGPLCRMYCPFGNVLDSRGCPICKCKTAPPPPKCEPIQHVCKCTYGIIWYTDSNGCKRCKCKSPKNCTIDGLVYLNGQTFKIDCNTCTCTNGLPLCTQIACPPKTCTFNGVKYALGQTYPIDKCNTCICTGLGPVCTEKLCPPDRKNCTANGKTYPDGARFKIDCNFCSCGNGVPLCTKIACRPASPPGPTQGPAAGDDDQLGRISVPFPPNCGPVCAIYCEFGNVLDSRGCPTCNCKQGPTKCGVIACKCPYGTIWYTDSNGCRRCSCKQPSTSPPPPKCTEMACYCPYGTLIWYTDSNGCRRCYCKPKPPTGAGDDQIGPIIEPFPPKCGPLCRMYCPFGNVLDSRGCPICKCKTAPSPVEDDQIGPIIEPFPPKCGPVSCLTYCPYGNVRDSRGCLTCRCKTAPSPPVVDPPSPPICGPLCMMYCPFGNVLDSRGCPICKCKTAPSPPGPIIEPFPPKCGPVCLIYCEFGNVLDARGCPICKCKSGPSNCNLNGVKYALGQTYTIDKCNSTCTCTNTGLVCKNKVCPPNPTPGPITIIPPGPIIEPFPPKCGPLCMMYCPFGNVLDSRGCPICKCKTGPCSFNGVNYNVGQTYNIDGCNTCRCTVNGPECTKRLCPAPIG